MVRACGIGKALLVVLALADARTHYAATRRQRTLATLTALQHALAGNVSSLQLLQTQSADFPMSSLTEAGFESSRVSDASVEAALHTTFAQDDWSADDQTPRRHRQDALQEALSAPRPEPQPTAAPPRAQASKHTGLVGVKSETLEEVELSVQMARKAQISTATAKAAAAAAAAANAAATAAAEVNSAVDREEEEERIKKNAARLEAEQGREAKDREEDERTKELAAAADAAAVETSQVLATQDKSPTDEAAHSGLDAVLVLMGISPTDDVRKAAEHIVLPISVLVILVVCVTNMLRARTNIPECFVAIILAAVFGGILQHYDLSDKLTPEELSPLVAKVIALVNLPVIMFKCGWTLRLKCAFSNIGPVVGYGVVGCFVSIVAVGTMILLTGPSGTNWHPIGSAREAFAVAALISATDPVALRPLFTKLSIDPKLDMIVFGEGVLNSPLCIAVFWLLNNARSDRGVAQGTFRALWYLVGSVILGPVLGVVLTWIYRAIRQHSLVVVEVVYVFVSCYLSYSLAEVLSLSGIITTMCTACLMGIYMRPLMTLEGYTSATSSVRAAASLADTLIFIMVGLMVTLKYEGANMVFGWALVLFCAVSRLLVVYPLTSAANFVARHVGAVGPELTSAHQVLIWASGLRGGIPLVLALELNGWAKNRQVAVGGTLTVIMFMALIPGGLMHFLVTDQRIVKHAVYEMLTYEQLTKIRPAAGVGKYLQRIHASLHTLLVGDDCLRLHVQRIAKTTQRPGTAPLEPRPGAV
mmetsp:Transcript_20939/g.46837  ORF Transcript_20939/g.46837 Transcript_20939/m.46837 type:complete len:760 (+) Transcript_20939:79-2358(+)